MKRASIAGIPYNEYMSAHRWVYRNYGKATHCSIDLTHSSSHFEWANISGRYKRDIADWRQLCRRCHHLADLTDGVRTHLRRASKLGLDGRVRATSVRVGQYTKQGELVREFPSLAEAGRRLGIHPSGISTNVRGITSSAGGYIWKYM